MVDLNEKPRFNKRRFSAAVLILFIATAGYFSFKLASLANTIEVRSESAPFWQKLVGIFNFVQEPVDPDYIMPEEEPDRFDVLILGLRGLDDPDAKDGGALLTDSIMVFSYDKTAKKASLISIPRDFYVKISARSGPVYGGDKKDKINSAYEYGYYHKDGGISYTKELISKIIGVYIDKAVVINFSSFEKIIDQVGGIDIVLVKPFEEKEQWGYGFSLPAGPNHLDGKNALYYARSRFSTNDFDRARRQQQIIFALKEKLSEISLFSDPIKAFEVVKTLKSNVQTDIGIWDIKNMIELSDKVNGETEHYVISIENLVYESHISGMYVLLPNGDNFAGIKQLFQDIIK